ncbi:MAG: 1-deoxy-D-xylulose-5-phosphate synthase [Planctomycetota bacterium]
MAENFLPQLNHPSDLKKIPLEKLVYLSEEIRQEIIRVVHQNGGHLGSNLGVVDLTIALHYIFDFAIDRLVWDVSHQCYTHKILTGRKDKIDSLRLEGGLSGFTNKNESEYDVFTAGHAGTAISTALGIACGDSIAGRSRKIVAVVGDGAMTCGMSWEALNHCGGLKKDMLVILNDNKMSISHTIGAMANYLNKLRMTHLYTDIKKEVYGLLDRLPVVGHQVERALDHVRAAAVATMGGFIFEELGFAYYGPLDGHNIPLLVHTIQEIQRFKKPVILHIITDKGRGSADALNDPYRFHGIGPGKTKVDKVREELTKTDGLSYTDIFGRAMTELAGHNDKIVAITAAMPDGTGLVDFANKFPHRYFDVGICEQHAVGLSAGLANAGLKPVAAIYSTFLQRAFDQLFHEVALQSSNVIFMMDRAGLVGADGPTHHGVFDITYTRTLPGVILMSPKDGSELVKMLQFALTLKGPVFIRYPRVNIPDRSVPDVSAQFELSQPVQLGRAEVLKDGPDGAILAYGSMVYPALAAAEKLSNEEGMNLTVINARFAKPLDETLINRLVQEQPFIITVEEHSLQGGFGSAVLEYVNQNKPQLNSRPIICLGIPDKFIQHGLRDNLLKKLGLDVDGIAATARNLKNKVHLKIL